MIRHPLSLLFVCLCLAGCASVEAGASEGGQSSINTSPSQLADASADDRTPATAEVNPEMVLEHCSSISLVSGDLAYEPGQTPQDKLKIHHLIAEVPATEAETSHGLKERVDIHPLTAMLFFFDGDENPEFWMKDTPSSLDVIFFDATGRAFYMEVGTEPDSLRVIAPEDDTPIATAVLQLAAGRAEALGVMPGFTMMTHGALIPCNTAS